MKKTFLLVLGLILVGVPSAFAAILLDSSGATVFQQTINNPCVIGDSSCKQPTVGATTNHFDYTQFSAAPDTKWTNKPTSFPATLTGTWVDSIGFYDVTSPVPAFSGAKGTSSIEGSGNFLDDNGPYQAAIGTTGPGFNGTSDTIPLTFTIGIDVNYTTNQEQLVGFVTWVSADFNQATGTGTWSIDAANSYQPGSAQLLAQHNGNGFSDALLTGFNLTNGDYYFFEAIYGFEVAKNSDLTTGSDGDGMEEFFMIPASSTPVPEPTSLLLLGVGLMGLVAARRFKK